METPDDRPDADRLGAWHPPTRNEFDVPELGMHCVADQLHDDAVQAIIAARIRLDRARTEVDDTSMLAAHLDFIDRRLDYALRAVRSLDVGLVPAGPPTETVVDAITAAVDSVRDEFDLDVTATCSGRARQATTAAPIVHRVVLEALRNVARHARSGSATVDASVGDEIRLSIQDLGCGFARETHLEDSSTWNLPPGGLRRVADAARLGGGRLAIHSSPGRGTSLQLRLPFSRNDS
jgi:two-component system NarL family sensor kinase